MPDLATAITTSLATALAILFAGIPKLIAFLLILLVGWIIAGLLAGAVRGIMRLVRVDAAAGRAGVVPLMTKAGINREPSHVTAEVVKWLVPIAFVAIAGIAANFVAGVVRTASGSWGVTNGDFIAQLASGAIVVFGVLVALNQLGIAATFVNALFIGIVAACALAFGLAFGLGGREAAARMLDSWSPRSVERTEPILRPAQPAGNGRPIGDRRIGTPGE